MLISRITQILATAVLLCVSAIATLLTNQLQFSENHEALFRTDDNQFARYQQFVNRFQAEQKEITVLIQNHSLEDQQNGLFGLDQLSILLATQANLERLSDVARVMSIFSVPGLQNLATKAVDNDINSLDELRRKLSNRAY